MEPLFILNYETGEIEPWLGESFTANDTLGCLDAQAPRRHQVERRRGLQRRRRGLHDPDADRQCADLERFGRHEGLDRQRQRKWTT